MRIQPGPTDAPGFVVAVNLVLDGLLRESKPQSLIVVQIHNWFGQRWLGFSGVMMLQLGVWKQTLTIPPFVPNRVVSQRTFLGPSFTEVEPGEPIHRRVASRVALGRKISEVAPEALFVWYSGNSANTGRGSLMVYIPDGRSYRKWYAQWQNANKWHAIQADGIRLLELMRLMERESQLIHA